MSQKGAPNACDSRIEFLGRGMRGEPPCDVLSNRIIVVVSRKTWDTRVGSYDGSALLSD